MAISEAMSDRKRLLEYGALVLICVFAAFALVYLFSRRSDFKLDEYISLSIANNAEGTYIPHYEENHLFTDVNEPFLQRMTVQPGHAFDFAQTLRTDGQDTLPPLYYLLLHATYSLKPGVFSVWCAAIVNILIYVLCIVMLYRLARALGMRRGPSLAACALFATLPGILEIGLFIRMYVLVMLWVICITSGCVYLLDEKTSIRKGAAWVGVSLLGGALTHYYFLAYAFFLCLATGIVLLVKKRWKRAICLAGVAVCSAVLALLIFPAMIQQLFFGQLNDDGVNNLVTRGFLTGIWAFLSIINDRLAGGLLPMFVMVTAIAGGLLVARRFAGQRQDAASYDAWWPWIVTIVASILYFLMVSKSAFYLDTRYMSPIYAIMLVVLVGGLSTFVSHFFGNKAVTGVLLLVCSLTVSLCYQTYRLGDWEYANNENLGAIEMFNGQCQGAPAVAIYEKEYRATVTWMLNQEASGVVFAQVNNIDGLTRALPEDTSRIMLELDNKLDAQPILSKLQSIFVNCNKVEKLTEYAPYYDMYVLSNSPDAEAA